LGRELLEVRKAGAADPLTLHMRVEERAFFRSVQRLELMLVAENGEVMFYGLHCHTDRLDPVPPAAFGVIRLATGDGALPGEVMSAGMNALQDVDYAHGVLLEETDVVQGEGSIDLQWVLQPRDWPGGKYQVLTRVRRPRSPMGPWLRLGAFLLQSDGSVEWGQGQVQLVFLHAETRKPIPATD